jgi:hypothetical protein
MNIYLKYSTKLHFNSPFVKVPVLSKTTVVATAIVSINFASLNSKPFLQVH